MGILEVPVFTVEAALGAVNAGAHRIELCSDFLEGGTTPSAGLLSYLKSQVSIPIMVMIRPRGGDFVYSKEELEVMLQDIALMKALGADGLVFGVLAPDATVEIQANKRLLAAAAPLPCTFHRAFDLTPDLSYSLSVIQELGFSRILTSGGKASVTEGWPTILELINQAGKDLVIMPGGGTKPKHAKDLKSLGILQEVHASCKIDRDSHAVFRKKEISFSSNPERFHQVLTVDPLLVKEFLAILEE
jgi:copper homeostasis protein